ncbi:hypothetical protein ASPVEDRAFT_45365 [Aspergillus versicolor CBS 583.65]|uniref:Uncharacterized protein n=1 Tax=Aspergillus versicolor CBS 583.65 TaxID=1036611 RepID=A0A1L9PWM4_ASPVE|nr:uncharacterized protein ASPVEDRAFT_45365 [Aspergillus versicolor CBS 583.65]OJJ05934.1 hypothetical protein ASPVEDRAFT_45365 [Aspergillus versicolor CBS 583.65]
MTNRFFDRTKSKQDSINILAGGIAFFIIGGELLRWWYSSFTNYCANANDPHGDRQYYPSACYESNKLLFVAAMICFVIGGLDVLQGWIYLFYYYTKSLTKSLSYIFLLLLFLPLLCLLLLDYFAWLSLCILLLYGFYPLVWQLFWAAFACAFVIWTWR